MMTTKEICRKYNIPPSQYRVKIFEVDGEPRINVSMWNYNYESNKMIRSRLGLSIQPNQLDALIQGLTDAKRALAMEDAA